MVFLLLRYIPPRDNSKTAQDIAKIAYNDEDHKSIPLSVSINMFMKGQIMRVHSPSHDIKTSISMKNNNEGIGQHFEAKSELSAVTDIMNRDLVVEIELMQNESMFKPVIFVEEINQDCNVAMVSMIPRVFTKSEDEEQKCELIFLIDRSGSMGGSSIGKLNLKKGCPKNIELIFTFPLYTSSSYSSITIIFAFLTI